MEIQDLTLEETKVIVAVLVNTSFKLGDANRVMPIYQKLIDTINKLEPPKEEKKGA